ncbi:Uu.00g025440.m01.CDS01 [Anthostomella pinea]|uniref:Uu.00g025440.m01.CDS01 n=1 Tax=Anthostomella pinea TaxID=933095 RepID=A0AAI8V8C8_9PEZI|nr:Uu.00g025440.m01.CDS01 [Anthostomella pinea]
MGEDYKCLRDGRARGVVLLESHAGFHRVILDEAHEIRNRGTNGAKAVFRLQATHRLCMTRTPMMNKVADIFSLLRFLRIKPYDVWDNFRRVFDRPIRGKRSGDRSRAIQALQVLLHRVLFQRTENSKIDHKQIFHLPPLTTEQSKLKFNKYVEEGTVTRNYSNILVLIIRLRQCCCHPHLIRDYAIPQGIKIGSEQMTKLALKLHSHVVDRIKAQEQFTCPLCDGCTSNPVIIYSCGHHVCGNCFNSMMELTDPDANGGAATDSVCPSEAYDNVVDPTEVLLHRNFRQAYGLDESGTETSEEEDCSEESDEEHDADQCGNLRGFIVRDDIESTDEEEEKEQSTMDEELHGSAANSRSPKSVAGHDDGGDGPRHNQPVVTASQKRKRSIVQGPAEAGKKFKFGNKDKPKSGKGETGKKTMKSLAELKKAGVPSAKTDKVLELLQHVRAANPREKTLIFSQWTSFLDLLEVPIHKAGYVYRRYDGSMIRGDRDAAITDFMEKPEVTVFLISLKAGNAGLNLQQATRVIILDPFWNPSVEDQAVGRAHRIGQPNPVTLQRVVITGTIEDRILALQEQKRQLVSEVLNNKAAQRLNRLSMRELAGLFGL